MAQLGGHCPAQGLQVFGSNLPCLGASLRGACGRVAQLGILGGVVDVDVAVPAVDIDVLHVGVCRVVEWVLLRQFLE